MAALQTERALSWLFADIHRLLGQAFEARMHASGLTRAQWRILFTVRRFEGRTQTELADLLDMERAPLGKALDRLEAAGWLARRADPADRRIRRVYSLSKIQRYLPQAMAATKALFADALTGFGAGETEALIQRLTRIKINLGGAEDR